MSEETHQLEKRKKRPGASQVFAQIGVAIVSILAFRWLVFEMFVIPSGSMYPHLFVRDYIVATKSDFGVRLPFTQKWLLGPYSPSRGEVIIFKSLDDSKFFIKRVVGLPGDKIDMEGDFVSAINGEPVERVAFSDSEHQSLADYMEKSSGSFQSFKESLPGLDSAITVLTSDRSTKAGVQESYEVPPGHLLVMGDNRHKSYDGRYFGYLSMDHLIGKARFIVFSCGKYHQGTTSCDMKSLRFDRIGRSIRD